MANAIRAHLGEFGLIVPKGVHNMDCLDAEAEAADLPAEARMPLGLLVGRFSDTKTSIDAITAELRRAAQHRNHIPAEEKNGWDPSQRWETDKSGDCSTSVPWG